MRHLFTATAFAALLPVIAHAQIAQQDPAAERVFDSANAILDTSIPFAIGARQAQQSLRGAFGWDTFQEGLVGGVYFRFDPDGYARFSVSPRLDTDVFEVICRPRTYACEARKGTMQVILDARGRIQLKFDQITAGDSLFISEGVSELQLPERVLQPLDQRLEALLMAGGDLVIRRSDQEVAAISLQGFGAVVSYLRWVAARQDYTVLPRDWPVPNSANDTGTLTQAGSWNSPMPQPQRVPQQDGQLLPAQAADPLPDTEGLANEMESLRQELRDRASVEPQRTLSYETLDLETAERLARLELRVDLIWKDLQAMGISKAMPEAEMEIMGMATSTLPQPAAQLARPAAAPAPVTPPAAETTPSQQVAAVLAQELGIPAASARVLLETLRAGADAPDASATPAMQPGSEVLLHDSMVDQILNGIETTTPPMQATMPRDEYMTLAEYLGNIVSGRN